MDTTTLVDLVIPIYNLRKHRYNNFCFLIEQLSKARFENQQCNIVVCEQESSSTSIVETFLTKYTNIKHLIVAQGTIFNKSVVINHAFHNTDSEFFWMCDCDLSFDLEHVVTNLDISSDFIRPFDYVVSLTEKETEHYMKSGVYDNVKQEHTINNCTGKYSFIVRRRIFEEVGLMNEDFEGWGFQDLDFSENRMSDYRPNIISGVAYHLYHEKASRQHVDRNRRLYMNLGGVGEYEEVGVHFPRELPYTESERLQDELEPVAITQLSEVPVNAAEPMQTITQPTDVVVWSEVVKQIVYHHVTKQNVFNIQSENAVVYDDSQITTSSRSVLNRRDIYQHTRHYMYWYFKYIVDNYNRLPSVVIFLSDVYLVSPRQREAPSYRKILKFLETGPKNITTIKFIAGQVRHKLDEHGHFQGSNERKSRYTYTDWLSRYLSTSPSHTKIISPASGCMMIPRELIQKRPQEFYLRMMSVSIHWSHEDIAYCAASIDKLFS